VIRSAREAAPDAAVVVKIHPKEGAAERALIESLDPEVIVADHRVETANLLAASDVVVGTFSTTLLQAIALDRPTVSAVLWDDLDYWCRATDWSGVERVHDARALTESIRCQLDDPAHRASWSARRARFREDELVVDGRGTTRIVDLLERLVEAAAR
jgi:CDP-glycerol glycerophosphotransferase (TagB/SpsB family)